MRIQPVNTDGRGPAPELGCFVNLASLDLNLVVALRALLQERNVTRAYQRIGLSQPAMSAALARLRRHFDDDLLARVGGGTN